MNRIKEQKIQIENNIYNLQAYYINNKKENYNIDEIIY